GDLEVSEAPAEGDLLLVVQRLAPEEQHGMLLEGGADLRPRRIGKRPCDVGAVDPGGEARSEAADRDRHRATPKAAALAAGAPNARTSVATAASPASIK